LETEVNSGAEQARSPQSPSKSRNTSVTVLQPSQQSQNIQIERVSAPPPQNRLTQTPEQDLPQHRRQASNTSSDQDGAGPPHQQNFQSHRHGPTPISNVSSPEQDLRYENVATLRPAPTDQQLSKSLALISTSDSNLPRTSVCEDLLRCATPQYHTNISPELDYPALQHHKSTSVFSSTQEVQGNSTVDNATRNPPPGSLLHIISSHCQPSTPKCRTSFPSHNEPSLNALQRPSSHIITTFQKLGSDIKDLATLVVFLGKADVLKSTLVRATKPQGFFNVAGQFDSAPAPYFMAVFRDREKLNLALESLGSHGFFIFDKDLESYRVDSTLRSYLESCSWRHSRQEMEYRASILAFHAFPTDPDTDFKDPDADPTYPDTESGSDLSVVPKNVMSVC
jgi:hypothetical protein